MTADVRDITGLADRLRRHAAEGVHPSRGPLISVAAVLTLLDSCPVVLDDEQPPGPLDARHDPEEMCLCGHRADGHDATGWCLTRACGCIRFRVTA